MISILYLSVGATASVARRPVLVHLAGDRGGRPYMALSDFRNRLGVPVT